MEKTYNHKEVEDRILSSWAENGKLKANIDKTKEPYTIILPPPNASGKMHTGNVLMIAIEDLLIRWKRMKGYEVLWVPGTDHAGFETQTTFERELRQQGKSRLDFDRETLYKKIWDFVKENRGLIENQIKRMGASVDWSRYTFTLDDKALEIVNNTFSRMESEGLVYRDDYMVNYCPHCGTTFADLEVRHVTRKDPLYYIKYGPFVLATVRPETKFGDTAIAVHPDDSRYKEYIGKEIEVEGLIGNFKLKVIGDAYVDPQFGTGVVKVTPAHDKNDYEAGKRHNLEIKQVIGLDGKLTNIAGPYAGMKVSEARKVVVEDLKNKGLLVKVDEEYEHAVSVCYKKGHDIEPTILPNWFIKVESLKKPAKEVVEKGEVKIFPKWREITYRRWMEEMHDWPISRQTVWGIRIPAWYSVEDNPSLKVTFLDKSGIVKTGLVSELLATSGLDEIKKGLQSLMAPKDAKYVISRESPGEDFLQETDTFDTWFSSGQWPLITLGYPNSEDFKYFYPTSVLETGWEIIRPWVSRMIMFGIYLTGKPPFKNVYLHGLVRALDGKKMSKSLGNVIDPEKYIEEYGVDTLRMGLISGTANGRDFTFPQDKILGYRNFANKIWNMGRFILMMKERYEGDVPQFESAKLDLKPEDKEILEKLSLTIKAVDENLEKYRFADAGEVIYQFMWHEVADLYIEKVKNREDKDVALSTLIHVYTTCLKLLHPFMPFITEEIWGIMTENKKGLLMNSPWPVEK
ncbi:MAG: valine--tRNA ligase [Patescibacteria group bacterium]|jgi:valyl-tRNA synthetase